MNKRTMESFTEPIENNEQELINDITETNAISDEITIAVQHTNAQSNEEISMIDNAKSKRQENRHGKEVKLSSNLPETEIDYIAPQYQETFIKNLRTLELWALGWTFMNTAGLTLVIIFNSTFILGALQNSPPDTEMRALLTVLNGVGSAVGRLIMSYFEYWSSSRPPEKRTPFTLSLYFNLTTGIVTIALFNHLSVENFALITYRKITMRKTNLLVQL